jgi:hypothetical protein
MWADIQLLGRAGQTQQTSPWLDQFGSWRQQQGHQLSERRPGLNPRRRGLRGADGRRQQEPAVPWLDGLRPVVWRRGIESKRCEQGWQHRQLEYSQPGWRPCLEFRREQGNPNSRDQYASPRTGQRPQREEPEEKQRQRRERVGTLLSSPGFFSRDPKPQRLGWDCSFGTRSQTRPSVKFNRPLPTHDALKRKRRRELPITVTELMAIAPAARNGRTL